MKVKCFTHVIKKELVFCKSVDYEFFKQASFSFIEKLENLCCVSLFNIGDKVYPQLVRLFFATFQKSGT